jgi:hypothetical protein
MVVGEGEQEENSRHQMQSDLDRIKRRFFGLSSKQITRPFRAPIEGGKRKQQQQASRQSQRPIADRLTFSV